MNRISKVVERFSQEAAAWTGSSAAFGTAVIVTIGWLLSGPLYHYSDTWQLVINTVTNVVTFLMVFLIQRSQNKDNLGLNLKLNELVAAVKGASNRLIAVENLTEEELKTLQERYAKLVEIAQQGRQLDSSVSVEKIDFPSEKR